MSKKWFLFSLLFATIQGFALEVDEKLTVRLLKTTESRKTILINRGIEDGLENGDHAKFFMSQGVIARGVLVEVSPARSIWSLYRVNNADSIRPQEIINLKITPPMKLTSDETKSVVQDDMPQYSLDQINPESLGIPLAEGAQDLDPNYNAMLNAKRELEELKKELGVDISDKYLEIWTSVAFHSYSSTTVADGVSYDANKIYSQFSAGGEYYFRNMNFWYSKFSVSPFIQFLQESMLSYEGAIVESNLFELGGKINWHFLSVPHRSKQFHPFLQLSYAIGRVTDSFSGGARSTTAQATSEVDGSSTSYSIGVGVKYFVSNGFGARAIIDMYSRQDQFDTDTATGAEWTRDQSGPRIAMGLSYRF
jgi:hypothetical protein